MHHGVVLEPIHAYKCLRIVLNAKLPRVRLEIYGRRARVRLEIYGRRAFIQMASYSEGKNLLKFAKIRLLLKMELLL